jgi:hypothetical protein
MKTKNLLWKFAAVLAFATIGITTFAQEEAAGPDRRPVQNVFQSSLLIDQQTTSGPYKGGVELIIHHRFGTMQNGLKDLVGIYAPSNIRLGFNYGITDRLSVGIGTEKNNKMQDIYGKYLILQQKKTGMPISLSYLFELGIDARDEAVFGTKYAFTNRLSYFNQVIVSKKFGKKLSVQVAPSYTHFNAVDTTQWNDYIGISAGARYKIFNEFSVIATYDQGFEMLAAMSSTKKATREPMLVAPKPGFGLGIEIGTPTHCFQAFVGNYDKITPQKNFAYNQNTISNKKILVGFNLTVRF